MRSDFASHVHNAEQNEKQYETKQSEAIVANTLSTDQPEITIKILISMKCSTTRISLGSTSFSVCGLVQRKYAQNVNIVTTTSVLLVY